MYCSSEWQERESAILLVFSLSKYVTRIIDPEHLNTILLAGLHDASYEVLSMTVKTCCNIMANLILEKRVPLLQPVLADCVQHLKSFYTSQDVDLLLLLLSTVGDVVSAKQLSVVTAVEALNTAVEVVVSGMRDLQIFSDAKQMNVVRNAAGLLILYFVEYYSETLLEKGFVAPLVDLALRCISDGVAEVWAGGCGQA